MNPGVNSVEGEAILGGPHSYSSPTTRRRNPMACLICRRRKIKCEFNNRPDICDHCLSKNTKCTVLSVAQEEALRKGGYSDEYLARMSNSELESLLRQLSQPPISVEQTETHPTRLHQHYGSPSSPHHALQSAGQDNLYPTHDPANWAVPSSYTNSHHTAGRTGSTNPANVSANTPPPHSPHNRRTAGHPGSPNSTNVLANTPHLQAHSVHSHRTTSRSGSTNPTNVLTNTSHLTASRAGPTNQANVPTNASHPQQSSPYSNYSPYTTPSPIYQMPVTYQISATSDALVSHHTMPVGDHQEQLHPNIPAHCNAIPNQNHANYSGHANYPFQAAQQPSQGQYQYGGYHSVTATPDFTTRDSSGLGGVKTYHKY